MARNVLIVEDDSDSCKSLAHLLRGLGHNVRAEASAEDARKSLDGFVPDVALLDLRLPGLPGDAFAFYLKYKFPNLKIVFISGEFRLDEPERYGTRVDFIPKPLDFERLLQAIQD